MNSTTTSPGPNWFALRLTEDNRYRFLGQEEYFERYDEKYAAHLKEYQARVRAHASDHGRLIDFPGSLDGRVQKRNWLDNLGEDFWAGNWLTEAPTPAFELMEDEENERIELTFQGKPFFPVACSNGLTTLMFYEPESRTVLFTFDETRTRLVRAGGFTAGANRVSSSHCAAFQQKAPTEMGALFTRCRIYRDPSPLLFTATPGGAGGAPGRRCQPDLPATSRLVPAPAPH